MKKLLNLREFKNDPFGFILDTIIGFIVNAVVPLPLSGELVSTLRGPAIGCFLSMLLLALFMLVTIGTIIMSPFLVTSDFLTRITAPFVVPSNIASDDSFIETPIPHQNPLGGVGMSYVAITAYFLDPNYFLHFGKIHTGVDFVPTDTYYKNSKTYKETHQVVVFSTINGTVRHYVDGYGGETVEVTNEQQSLKAIFVHFSTVFVNSGAVIKAGTPIGIMGKSGFATGEHVHYEIQVKSGNSWGITNPLQYIQ
jgi:murein DD-endopeptidase MepM/ murein hydrolase activator NlpD